MRESANALLCLTVAVAALAVPAIAQPAAPTAAQQGFDKLKTLQGEWIDVDGVFGVKGAVAVAYEVTSGGNVVMETFPVNTPGAMVTVYHLDGQDLLLTHFCSSPNQPRMRSNGLDGNTLAFDFDGGTNIDPATTSHMHAATIQFVSSDEVIATWQNWRDGKPAGSGASFRIARKQ